MEPRDNVQGKDRLDRCLDAALREYGSAEPRLGLEGRVLANLAAERVSLAARRRCRWVLGAAAAAAACVGVVVWIDATHHPAVDYVASGASSAGQEAGATSGTHEVKQPVAEAVQRRTPPREPRMIAVARAPRLSQFPSPRALSEQERLLLRYVTEAPNEAVLIANEQAERQKELEKLSGDESSKIDSDR